jgi:hypothetical protein
LFLLFFVCGHVFVVAPAFSSFPFYCWLHGVLLYYNS